MSIDTTINSIEAIATNRYQCQIFDMVKRRFVIVNYRLRQYDALFGTSDSSNIPMKMEVVENKPKINLLNTKRDVSFED